MRIDPKASFVHFVYPFLFDPEQFEARVAALESAQWPDRKKPLKLWKRHSFHDRDLLPHVARYLNPPKNTSATACSWELMSETLTHASGLGARAEWSLSFSNTEIPFLLEAVQITVFRVGVGMIAVRAKPKENDVARWLDFLHYFRFTRGERRTGIKSRLRRGLDEKTRQPLFEPFFPMPAGGVAEHPEGTGTFGEILKALLHAGSVEGETTDWWEEVFVPGQMLPFAALFVDGMPEQETPQLLHRLRNFFHSRQEIHPATEDLRLDNDFLLAYAQRQWFVFALEGGTFVACDPPNTQFFRETLPSHLRDKYFLLFLLTLHQRFALMKLSDEVAKHWLQNEAKTDEKAREAVFGRIRDALLAFTARGHFTQVMQQEHHHRCYRKWQTTFQVDALHQEVSNEVQEMHNYLMQKRTEQLYRETQQERLEEARRERAAKARAQRLEQRISLLGVVIGVPAIILSVLDVNILGVTSKDEGLSLWLVLLIGLGGGLVGAMALLWLLRRGISSQRRAEKGDQRVQGDDE